MKKILAFSTLFLLLSVSLIFAQRTTGMIEGTIYDEEGSALPGVMVAISGPTIAEKTLESNLNGMYRFPALPPGEYTLTVTLPGFKKYTQTRIVVPVEQTIVVNITLEVGTIEEEITVIGESPVVDLTSSRLTTNVKKEYFDALPKGRTYQDMAYLAPSVQPDRWGIGMSGATGAENLYIIDGINTTDVEDGVLGTNLTYEFIEEVQIKTGGYEAEFGGAMGGVVNVITKSGTNEFHGGAWVNYQNDAFYGNPTIGIFGDGSIDDFSYYDFGLSFSGPLVKDKVWFFLGATPSFRTTHYSPENSWTGETQTFDETRNTYYFSGKLTFEVSPGHKITASVFGDPVKGKGENPGTLRDFDTWEQYAIVDYTGGSYNFALKYDGLFGSDWLVHGLVGLYRDETKEIPTDTTEPMVILEQGYLGYPVNYRYGGRGWYCDPELRKRWQASLDLTKYMGVHTFKIGSQFNRATSLRVDHYTGGYYRQVRPDYGYFRDRWRTTEGESYTDIFALFLQDSWKVTDSLTVNIGVRVEDQNIHASDKSRFEEPGGSIIHWTLFEQISPRLGFTFDILGTGSSKLFGSYGRFFEMVPLDINNRQFGAEFDKMYWYDIDLGDPLTYVPDLSEAYGTWEAGSAASEFPEPDEANKGLNAQYVEEFILGFENQFATDLSVSIRGVWKRLGEVVEDGSFDGGSVYFLFNPGTHFIEGETNPDTGQPRELYVDAFPAGKRDYKALEIMLNKRFSNNYMATISYTYARLRGNHPGLAWEEYGQLDPNITALFDFPEFLYNADGILPNDRPHQFKVDGVYVFPSASFLKGLSVGTSFRFRSGQSLTKMGYNAWYGRVACLSERGADGRLPSYYQLDAHLGYDLRIGDRYKIGFTLDVFNIFNTKIEIRRDLAYLRDTYFGTPDTLMPWDFNLTAYPSADNEYYGKGIWYQDPIRLRLGIVFSF